MALATLATWAPILPKPTTPKVFLYTSLPTNFLRSHLPFLTDWFALGIWRDKASIIAKACSAAAIVFPSGELTTTIP